MPPMLCCCPSLPVSLEAKCRGPLSPTVAFGTASLPYQPYVPCALDALSPSGGSWAAAGIGQCVQVCRNPPAMGNAVWPASCIYDPVTTIGGTRTSNGVCAGGCAYGFAGSPQARCSSGTWSYSGTCLSTAPPGACGRGTVASLRLCASATAAAVSPCKHPHQQLN